MFLCFYLKFDQANDWHASITFNDGNFCLSRLVFRFYNFYQFFLADQISVSGLETFLNYCYLEQLHFSSEDAVAETLRCFRYFKMSEEVKFLAEIVIANMNVENSFKWYSVFKDLALKEFEGKAGQFLKVFPSPFYVFFNFIKKMQKPFCDCMFVSY